MIWLAAVALVVGVLIGAVGVGGILLIPALNLLTTLSIQASMATALFTFIFTGIVGSFFFQRRGSIDWSVTIPLCVGGALFGVVGAWANATLDAKLLALILAALIVLAGVYTLFTGGTGRVAWFHDRPRLRLALLFGIGALTGFGSGLTGVGGPALSVPMMVLCGFAPLTAIGASQVIQILAAVSGSAGHLAHGAVDIELASLLTVFEVAGVWIGVHLAHAIDAGLLRRAVGVLCVLVGAGLLLRSI
ncbi:sulfite exporter TauE/SafE family protein [Methylibium sp.]|uniref:sulfite exporter TauE/SafE family protein n=1 Tax=Methylibium sp. TaxID=2067992 RepID=UPI003D0FD988